MKALNYLLHLFTPRPSNNHRAKLLHTSSITLAIVFLIVFQIGLSAMAKISPSVLGYASNINASDLLNDTNKKRAENGAPALALNDKLNQAAAGKASDMFSNQYWAHVSPQGKDPWAFIAGAGYSYIFAGENLARDFGDSQAVVDAWMNSPSHRDNLLNARFKEVGFAVLNGKYGNDETTLVVQMFGTQAGSTPTVTAPQTPPVSQKTVNQLAPSEPVPAPIQIPAPSAPVASPSSPATPAAAVPPSSEVPTGTVLEVHRVQTPAKQPIIDVLAATRTVSSGLILVFLIALVVDSTLVYKRRIIRLSGHNFAHLLVLLAILAALNLIGRGLII